MMGGRSALQVLLAVAIVATLAINPLGLAAVERSSPVGDAAAQDCVREVVETFQKGTLPDEGESLNTAIDDALSTWNVEDDLGDLEEYDLDELKEMADEADDPAARSVDEMAEQVERMTEGPEVADAD